MANEEKKLSYEELQQVAIATTEENKQLKANLTQALGKLKEYSDFSAYKRLDYLFKAVELRDAFSSEFIITCVNEIEVCMYPPQDEAKEEQK